MPPPGGIVGGMTTEQVLAAARAQDIQRLALQLLENACTIDAAMPLLPPHSLCASLSPLDRSH